MQAFNFTVEEVKEEKQADFVGYMLIVNYKILMLKLWFPVDFAKSKIFLQNLKDFVNYSDTIRNCTL